ncbi:immunity 49 family protein [Streptomyces sp. NPDC052114]|uniref:immunity 49 family protein n=1 Tax=unclassified Streptomyces TaxID=2593676 RepID=UPI00343D6E94
MGDVARHEVDRRHIDRALEDIAGRAFSRWHSLRYDALSLAKIRAMQDELLDHVAARTARGAALDVSGRSVLRTAAECALGALSVGCFPDGDQEIPFPVIGEVLSSESVSFGDHVVEQAPTARTWVDTFAICVVSGAVWEWQRVMGLLLRGDYASEIRDGVPYSKRESVSRPADLAEMDALCGYLTEARGHLPRHWPKVPLCRPDAEQRAAAAGALDAAGPLTPDQRLLRVLLDDDRQAFEEALVARLVAHRESAGADAAPRSLLPIGTLALAALAVQVHGWELGVRSGYLPPDLLGTPDALERAADGREN